MTNKITPIQPKRIQRKRTKGWRMPENTKYVGRGSRWGNPYPIYIPSDREVSLDSFGKYLEGMLQKWPDFLEPLRGYDLACWCSLDQPCHADIILKVLNR